MVFLLVTALFPHALAKEEQAAFSQTAPDKHRPYNESELTLNIPDDGFLKLSVFTGSEEMPVMAETAVTAGSLTLPFTGLTTSGEPLPRGQAILKATLKTDTQEQTAKADILIQTPAAGVMYAILSRDVLPRAGGEDLYVDYQLGKDGYLIVKLYKADDLDNALFTKTLQRKDALPHAYRWDKKIKGEPAPAGDYVFTFEAKGSRQEPLSRPFKLTDEAPLAPAFGVTEQGKFLPTSLDDEAVWAAMMAPIARVTIGAIAHQKVYSQPDSKAEVLGVMHGQTAGVLVLKTDVNGYALVRSARQGDGQWMTGYIPQDRLEMASPSTRYGLLIDKAAQTITLYEEGKKLSTLRVSTGVYVPPGDTSFDTVPGAFLTEDRIAEFPSEGYRYLYAMRIDGGNLLHSAGYKLNSGLRDFSNHQQRLGGIASHGCVRIDNRVNPEGYNAWWLYANLPRNTKVLVLPGNWAEEGLLDSLYTLDFQSAALSEPVSEATANTDAVIVAEEPLATPAPEAQQSLPTPDYQVEEVLPIETTITLTFGGDTILGSEEHSRKLPESFDSVVAEKGNDWPFSGLYDILSRDDLSMVNLEGVLKNDAGNLYKRVHNFRGPEAFAGILTLGSVEAVNIANNHFPDYGQDGKNSTRAALDREGILVSGYSDLAVFEKDGIKIGFGGIRETIYKQDRNRIAREIEELKRQGCAYIVYTCHFGNEYEVSHNTLQTEMAHKAIDAGANLVIGHHPHVVQGIEEYKGGLIIYSLGNLVFGGNLSLTTFDGLMAQVEIGFAAGKPQQTAARLIPVITSSSRPANDFRPIPATGEDKARILAAIAADSARPYEEYFIVRGE